MNVCADCFNDIELKSYINSNYNEIGNCDFCTSSTACKIVDINELLDFFAELLSLYKINHDGIELIKIIDIDWDLFSVTTDKHRLLQTFLDNLSGIYFNLSDRVSYKDSIENSAKEWFSFKEDIMWEKRFLIDKSTIKNFRLDIFLTNKSDEEFYRARLHSIENENIPIERMGRPPKNMTTEGRANPRGIPYLYLSEEEETTLYEIRATYLDEVSIGKFKIINGNTLNLVDFRILPMGIFDLYQRVESLEEYTKIIRKQKSISKELSKPLRRYDSNLEYIPTQVICEYFRRHTNFDGILFNSSLHEGGKNIVLFNEDKVECIKVEKHRINKIEIKSDPISE